MEHLLREDKPVLHRQQQQEEEEEDSPILIFNELTEMEWVKKKCQFEVGEGSCICDL